MVERDESAEAYAFEARRLVAELDSELLEYEDTRQLIELGIELGREVTELYGTPTEPRWASGSYEKGVLMAYHNGGKDGHTSLGPLGAGVPRNVLVLAAAINETAPFEVFSPKDRAAAFAIAMGHDRYQLCGRSLAPEGQGDDRGDERLSAEDIRSRYLAKCDDEAYADKLYMGVMATAFNPKTGTQNVDYSYTTVEDVLLQELVAAADLLSPSTARGPLSSIEYTVEAMCLKQGGQILQQGAMPQGTTKMAAIMKAITGDRVLRETFANNISKESHFFANGFHYSDSVIRDVCGRGVDELFPLRKANAAVLHEYGTRLLNGGSPLSIWRDAQKRVLVAVRS